MRLGAKGSLCPSRDKLYAAMRHQRGGMEEERRLDPMRRHLSFYALIIIGVSVTAGLNLISQGSQGPGTGQASAIAAMLAADNNNSNNNGNGNGNNNGNNNGNGNGNSNNNGNGNGNGNGNANGDNNGNDNGNRSAATPTPVP